MKKFFDTATPAILVLALILSACPSSIAPGHVAVSDISITVSFTLGDIAITGSDGINAIRKTGAPSSLAFSAEGYTDVVWYVDGGTPGITSDTLTINVSDYAARIHSVTFTGKKNGVNYSSRPIPFGRGHGGSERGGG